MKMKESIPSKKELLTKRRKQGNICGNPNCRCKDKKNPVLHGPYYYLSNRYKDKMQTLFLNDKKMKYAEKGIKNYNELFDAIYELCYINFLLVRYYYKDKLI